MQEWPHLIDGKCVMKIKNKFLFIICILLTSCLCIPYIVSAFYTFPLQDDFYNTTVVNAKMYEENINAFRAAVRLAVEGYTGYRGYYFSLFLIYFADGLLQCSVTAIQIVQSIILLLFFGTLGVLTYTFCRKIARFESNISIVCTLMLEVCFTGMFYFVNNETFFWLCASTVYLLPTVFLFIYITLLISFIFEINKYYYLVILCPLGFLVGGASVNVAALGCFLAVLAIYWGIVVKRKILKSIVGGIPIIIGGMLNVFAPGNFRGENANEVLDCIIGASKFVINRWILFGKQSILLWGIIIVLIVLFIFNRNITAYKYPLPITFSLLMFVGTIATIFPVMYSSNVAAYDVYERAMIVSDWTMYIALFLTTFYWTGWISVRLANKTVVSQKSENIISIISVCALVVIMIFANNKVANIRLAKEFVRGEVQEYGVWASDIIKQVKNSEDSIVRIYTRRMEDTTCLANPYYCFEEYDPKTEYTGNSAMAQFYNKEAVYIYTD